MNPKKPDWDSFFSKMDKQIAEDEARAARRSRAKAPGYYKYFTDDGYRGRILPRHQNLPHHLFPYGNTCMWCEPWKDVGFCRRTINESCHYRDDARYCPYYSEKSEYREELNAYHHAKGNIDYLTEWYRKKHGIR